MSSQQQFINYMLNESDSFDELSHGYFEPGEVMNIYRNNYYYTLTSALSATYSCVKRLVGDEFFEFLCKNYIQNHPSISGNIIDYGADFSAFIKDFEHCQSMPYLTDIAMFEHLYEQCYHNPEHVYFLSSKYAIIEIWQLSDESEEIDIEQTTYIRISHNNSVIVERLTKVQYETDNT